VVAPRHEHIIELYGPDWPGLVRGAADWHDSIVRAMAVDTTAIHARRTVVRGEVQRAWSAVLGPSRCG
jgi:hypothetical protein